jgi:type IV secretion system protein TrbC
MHAPSHSSYSLSRAVFVLTVTLAVLLLLLPHAAHASEGTGGGLPYESWLTDLRKSVTGPFAFTVSVVGIVIAGSMLIWGGELSGFFKTMVYIVLVMALIVGVNNVMSTFFGRGAELASAVNPTLNHPRLAREA